MLYETVRATEAAEVPFILKEMAPRFLAVSSQSIMQPIKEEPYLLKVMMHTSTIQFSTRPAPI